MKLSERACISPAVFAVAAMKGKIHLSEEQAAWYHDYSAGVQAAIVTDMKEAWRISAYVIERPFYGNGRYGWRLNKYCNGSGETSVSPMFLTRQAFADAMRTVEAMVRQQ